MIFSKSNHKFAGHWIVSKQSQKFEIITYESYEMTHIVLTIIFVTHSLDICISSFVDFYPKETFLLDNFIVLSNFCPIMTSFYQVNSSLIWKRPSSCKYVFLYGLRNSWRWCSHRSRMLLDLLVRNLDNSRVAISRKILKWRTIEHKLFRLFVTWSKTLSRRMQISSEGICLSI